MQIPCLYIPKMDSSFFQSAGKLIARDEGAIGVDSDHTSVATTYRRTVPEAVAAAFHRTVMITPKLRKDLQELPHINFHFISGGSIAFCEIQHQIVIFLQAKASTLGIFLPAWNLSGSNDTHLLHTFFCHQLCCFVQRVNIQSMNASLNPDCKSVSFTSINRRHSFCFRADFSSHPIVMTDTVKGNFNQWICSNLTECLKKCIVHQAAIGGQLIYYHAPLINFSDNFDKIRVNGRLTAGKSKRLYPAAIKRIQCFLPLVPRKFSH